MLYPKETQLIKNIPLDLACLIKLKPAMRIETDQDEKTIYLLQ